MTRAFSRLLLVGVVFAAAACDEEMIGLDQGTPSALDVRAYVDANGNGTFDSGTDTPIASATVTLTGGGGQSTESTGSDGVASFSGLAPGSYQVSLSGDVPAGAVLAGAPTATVVAPFRGQSLSTEFRYAYLPGEISGVVFRDDNGNQELDAGDTPAEGLAVALFAGATTSGEALAETTTDGAGSFLFTTLRPGTYTLQFDPFPTIELVGGTTRTVTVDPDTRGDVPVQFTGNLVVTIAEAKGFAGGETVAVEATVISTPDDRSGAIQDETAGIFFFDFDLADKVERPLEIGDVVRMIGTLDEFRGEVQISPIESVAIVGSEDPPVPRPVSADEINSGAFQGQLAVADGVVANKVVFGSGDHVVTMTDDAGGEFDVFVDTDATSISADIWEEGQAYGVTGVLGAFEETQQLEPRMLSDVKIGGSAITIAEARATAEGETVTVEGIVTSAPDNRSGAIQDETAGIFLFDFDLEDKAGRALQRGDVVRVVGQRGSFNGEVQISPITVAEISGTAEVPDPRPVTGTEVNAGTFQGQLAVSEGVVQSFTVFGSGDHVVTIRDDAGDDFTVFVDLDKTGVSSDVWTEGERYRVTGVLGAFNADQQLEIRDSADVENLG